MKAYPKISDHSVQCFLNNPGDRRLPCSVRGRMDQAEAVGVHHGRQPPSYRASPYNISRLAWSGECNGILVGK